jgi:SpoIID/LytB domain protein
MGVPNKTGLNQYGAKGRAEAGKNYQDILGAYYNNVQIVDYGTGYNIKVNGTNSYKQTFNNETYNIEEYLKHLYEMPTSWNSEALKAQAIAARSYALARTNNGQNSIPPDESGQVVKKELNDQRWIDAVTSTSGKVMVQNGKPISAWYSSTHGGVVLRSGQIGWADTSWTKQIIDTPSNSAGGFGDLKANAYDRQSPWFFCDWGRRAEYNNTAWLKEDEVVDIVNAYILWEKDNSKIVHLGQTDKPTGDTWSAERVRQELGGSAINAISSIGVDWDSSGISQTIRVNGRGYNAQKFKNLFNLRAPANIQIKPSCQPDSGLNCSKMYALYEVVKE